MFRRPLLLLATLALASCSDYSSNSDAVGNLTVLVVTAGTPDPDGYTVDVTGQTQRMLSSTDTTYYLSLPIDDYTVTLGEVEAGCTVTDGAVRHEYVNIGANEVQYNVTCP